MDETYLKKTKAKAAKYCAYRERAPLQVSEKLRGWGLPDNQIEQIVHELREEGFISELRFCRAFCHDKFEFNQWGKVRIRQELHRYGLKDEIVQQGLDYIDPVRYEMTLKKLAGRKWDSLSREKEFVRKKHKTMNFLLQKGFEPGLIKEIVNKLSVLEH